MRDVAIFDFDGTLTRRDSFMQFAVFARGYMRTAAAFALSLPAIVKWKMGLIPSSKAKETVFRRLFAGMSEDRFNELGRRFAARIRSFERTEIVDILTGCVGRGIPVYIISASVPQWIRPWAESLGVTAVEGTEVEIVDGRLTGRFSSPNCRGEEKVRRLDALVPQPAHIIAYGDSSGDDALLARADAPHRV